jgi:glycosyltransferase involved in cell wall biosynthesis
MPTFNRRPFIPIIIECFNNQTYPKDKIEWIIIDDGTDKIEDLVVNIPQVKYFKYDQKMTLGVKRNLTNSKASGDILIYMDDDDYYPPERISHAVETLRKNPKALCAGSSEVYLWFNEMNKMYRFGPYGPTHATAGTFAFKRVLLKQTRYEETAQLAEEKFFLITSVMNPSKLHRMKKKAFNQELKIFS